METSSVKPAETVPQTYPERRLRGRLIRAYRKKGKSGAYAELRADQYIAAARIIAAARTWSAETLVERREVIREAQRSCIGIAIESDISGKPVPLEETA